MVKVGQRILKGVAVSVTTIDQIKTPLPTESDKDSIDIGAKIRYLIDKTEQILEQFNIKLSEIKASGAETPRTLSNLYDQLVSILGQLDITLSALRDGLRGVDAKTLTDLYNMLNSIDTKIVSQAYDSGADLYKLSIERDNVGLAKDSTLSSINSKITKVDTDNVKVVSAVNPPNLDIAISALRDALKPTRTTPAQVLTDKIIAAGVAEEFTVDATQTDGFSALVVTVKASYDVNATQGVRVRWRYSPDGVNYDSVEDAEASGNYEDLTFSAGKTRTRTILIPLFMPYVRVQIVNLDSSFSVTVSAWTTLMR